MPAVSRACFNSERSAAYSFVCDDFSIAPIIGACYDAPKIGAHNAEIPQRLAAVAWGIGDRATFKKIRTVKLQKRFANCLISASLDLFAAARLKKSGSVIKIHRRGQSMWRINDCTYKFYPIINDEVIFECYRLGELLFDYTLFVAPGFDSVLRNAIDGLGIPHVSVFSIDQYVTWRLTWDSYDFDQTSNETLIDLIRRYNDWIHRTSSDERLLVEVPKLPALSQ